MLVFFYMLLPATLDLYCYLAFFNVTDILFIGGRCYPPASEASREVANLTERKNPHTPVYVTEGRLRW